MGVALLEKTHGMTFKLRLLKNNRVSLTAT